MTDRNGEAAPIDKERFVNRRAEDYWTLREIFEAGEVDIDPDDDLLAAQLGSINGLSTAVDESRSSQRTTCASVGCRRRTGRTSLHSPSRPAAPCTPSYVEDHAGHSVTGDLVEKAW